MVQRVALKVIKPGMDSHAVVARFEQERQALAVLDHPNVARVFDGGVTASGRPYFAMEHVQGEPITTFCDRHTYTIGQRLALFVRVCEAVQHAHMKGIIHRDLKPSNILVGIKAGDAVPKVIDFGVAKAVSRTLTEKTIFTEHGMLIGTPEYMSPEHAEMGWVDIDTRTDVYALGVVLYELVTGLLPFDAAELRRKGYAEIQQVIREVDPPAPSQRLTTIAEATASAIAERRRSDPGSMARVLRRELEWIPLKAIRKDRVERYASAEAFAADIRRYLSGEALEAGPESRGYRLRKVLWRYRVAVSVCGAVGAALAIGLAGTLWQAREARAAEAFARAREQQAESLSRFLVDELFDSVEPERETREIGVVELLDRASTALEASSSTPPTEVEARIRHALGTIYNRLGEPGRAWPHNERAWEIRDALPRSAVPKAALSLNDSAYRLDRIEALPFDLRTLQNEAGVSPDDRWALRLREGNTLKSQHHFDAAIAVYEEIWRSRGTADTAPDDVLLAARHNIGVCLILAGRAAEGEERSRRLTEAAVVLEESAALRAARSGAASYPAMESRYEHAKALHHLQRLEEAIREYESLRAGLPRCVRNENFRYVELLESLAYAYEQTHRLEEAISAHREAVVLRTESPACGPGHPATLDGVGFYVDALLLAGRAEEAGAEVERAVRAAEQAGVSATSNSLIGLRAKMSAPPTKDP